jgi:hypothetical protein
VEVAAWLASVAQLPSACGGASLLSFLVVVLGGRAGVLPAVAG